jgi:hypothetical protein
MRLAKADPSSSHFQPLESATLLHDQPDASALMLIDAAGRPYLIAPTEAGREHRFVVRGSAGTHRAVVLAGDGAHLDELNFRLAPRTDFSCARGSYAKLGRRLANLLNQLNEPTSVVVSEKLYAMQVCWLRDHTYVLKAQKYFIADVTSGTDFYIERQQPSGMIWDNLYRSDAPGFVDWRANLGEGFYAYEDQGRWVVVRIPCEADVEYILVEAVYYGWKASGDDAWMKARLPALHKALRYAFSDPLRWSRKHQLVKRAYTTDSWDFINPHLCKGDHRIPEPGQPMFIFHGDIGGYHAALTRLAEMHASLGDDTNAQKLLDDAASMRDRATKLLWKGSTFAHMVPESPVKGLKQLVGDDDQRMSLSLGYTINRGLADHAQAVAILDEYQRRRKLHARTSFAEWWTMDPMYTPEQWPGQHTNTAGCPMGEYMNGSISPLVAGELAKAAFDHGREAYGADILRRVWDLSERDGGHVCEAYRRAPEKIPFKRPSTKPVDLRAHANVGLKHNAHKGVIAWTGEGDNDLRNLPVGKQVFQGIAFDVIEPKKNKGLSIVSINAGRKKGGVPSVEIDLKGKTFASMYFLHATGTGGGPVAGYYDLVYADGTSHRVHVRPNQEIGLYWGARPLQRDQLSKNDANLARVAWQGANPTFGNVGIYVWGMDNPHADKPVKSIRMTAAAGNHILLAGLSTSTEPVRYPPGIRSYGLPDTWSQGAVFYALAEGLAGIEDAGRGFDRATISSRWAVTESPDSYACLHYPASNGYCAYRQTHDAKKRAITLDVTGSFSAAKLRVLLPASAKKVKSVVGTEGPMPFELTTIERSRYVEIELDDLPLGEIRIAY